MWEWTVMNFSVHYFCYTATLLVIWIRQLLSKIRTLHPCLQFSRLTCFCNSPSCRNCWMTLASLLFHFVDIICTQYNIAINQIGCWKRRKAQALLMLKRTNIISAQIGHIDQILRHAQEWKFNEINISSKYAKYRQHSLRSSLWRFRALLPSLMGPIHDTQSKVTFPLLRL